MSNHTDRLAWRLRKEAERHPGIRFLALAVPNSQEGSPMWFTAISPTETRTLGAIPEDLRHLAKDTLREFLEASGYPDGSLLVLYNTADGDAHFAAADPVPLLKQPRGHLAVPLPNAEQSLLWLDMGKIQEEGDTLIIREPEHPPLTQIVTALAPWRPLVNILRENVPDLTPHTPQEEAMAITALAVRHSYLAALIDDPLPSWHDLGLLRPGIFDAEMKRLNIEISAALTQLLIWRHQQPEGYASLLTAARLFLPVSVDTRTLNRRDEADEGVAPLLHLLARSPDRQAGNLIAYWVWRSQDRLERLHSKGYRSARPGTRCLPPGCDGPFAGGRGPPNEAGAGELDIKEGKGESLGPGSDGFVCYEVEPGSGVRGCIPAACRLQRKRVTTTVLRLSHPVT